MRRLAKQDRDDTYSTKRDYQEIHEELSQRLTCDGGKLERLIFRSIDSELMPEFVGIGMFVLTPDAVKISVTVLTGLEAVEFKHQADHRWSRLGRAVSGNPDGAEVLVQLDFDHPIDWVDIWGLQIGEIDVASFGDGIGLGELNQTHLLPETLLLEHFRELGAIPDGTVTQSDGTTIYLKKCSYCGRRLPLDPDRPSQLSFHKHNAKVSRHQNECRACKKWRINNAFNPLRTVDQLNESSVITRERKLLLKEPEILHSIKERTGRGLKSIVWERFGKRCFVCKKELELREVQLDHTRPLAYLWPIDEHATCLCAEHNNQKKDTFPVDFYTEVQLRELAEITGLSFEELSQKHVCVDQLKRITADIVDFAKRADARTFLAVSRKVAELSEIDLMAELRRKCAETAHRIEADAKERPDSVGQ
mgnify:CR=1 FL=1